jgi:hypothetical protein
MRYDSRTRVEHKTLESNKSVTGNGTAGFSGDGGPATAASLNFPTGVFMDGAGVLYIADARNERIRKVVLNQLVTFTSFTATVKIALGPRAGDDTFNVEATFTPGAASNGINPVTEPVTLQVDAFSTTIPASSFTQDKKGQFVFTGTLNGVKLKVQIVPSRGRGYTLQAKGKGGDLSGTVTPVSVELTIGDDTGQTTAVARCK